MAVTPRFALAAVTAAALVAAFAQRAGACTCGLPLSVETMPQAAAVFTGRIAWFPQAFTAGETATFCVDRVYVGDLPRYLAVESGGICNDGIWWWGGRYVVFADRGAGGSLYALPCVGSAPVDRVADVIERLGPGSEPPASPIDGLLVAVVFGGVGLLLVRWSRGRRLER